MKKQIIISEDEWEDSIYKTKEWEQSVEVLKWEHDYIKKEYIITYDE